MDERMKRLSQENEAWKTWERMVARICEQQEADDLNREMKRWNRDGTLKSDSDGKGN